MAPQQKPNQQGQSKNGSAKDKGTKTTRLERLKNNKPLFAVVFLIALILIAAIGVGAYLLIDGANKNNANNNTSTANNNGNNNNGGQTASESNQNGNNNQNGSNNNNDNGGNGQTSSSGSNAGADALTAGQTQAGQAKSNTTQNEIAASGIWKATDYEFGDIVGSNYAIEYGDTLWEISEASLGSGFEWRRILNANPGKVGFLPNGEQALIFPNQLFVLPK